MQMNRLPGSEVNDGFRIKLDGMVAVAVRCGGDERPSCYAAGNAPFVVDAIPSVTVNCILQIFVVRCCPDPSTSFCKSF